MPTFFHHELLCRARVDLGLTQEQAAAAAGVDVRTYRRYESGEVNDPRDGFSIRHASRRRIVARIARELGLDEGDLLVEKGLDSAPARGLLARHEHPLPRARHFVGRADLLDELAAWHRDQAAKPGVIAIVAIGGAGKTSVVERLLARLGDGPREGGTFVWSFYDEPRIEAFFERALAYFAPSSSALPGERDAALAAALRGGPHLVVIDGLEIVQGTGAPGTTLGRLEDPALRRLFTSFARGLGDPPARLLVTSRVGLVDLESWEGDGLRTVRLDALSREEGAALLGLWGLEGEARDLAPLAARVGGHALSVAMMGSYAGAFLGGDRARASAIDLEPAARDDATARRLLSVLSAYARALPAAERDLVARLSLFASGATIDALAAIARAGGAVAGATGALDPAAIERALARLARLGLVSPSGAGDRFATHPFLAEYFRSLLGVPKEAIHAVTRDAIAARLDVHRAGVPADLLDAYEELCAHTRASGRAEEAWGIYQRALGGFAHVGLRLGEMRRGARLLAGFFEGGNPAALQSTLPRRTHARIAYDLGLYAGALGDLDLAVRSYRAHNDQARALHDLDLLATGLRTLAYTERLKGSFGDALALAEAAIDVSRGAGARGNIVRALALRASIHHDLGQTTLAGEGFAEARALGDVPFARRALWEAEHLLDTGRAGEARAMTEKNVEVCRELGWEGHAAHGSTLIGHCLLASEPPDTRAAQRHLDDARRWAGRTGELDVVLRCSLLEAEIFIQQGARAEALSSLQTALDIAEGAGFGWFVPKLRRLAALARGG